MHVPSTFKETDIENLHGMIRSHPLGTWVTTNNDDLIVNHIPFELDENEGEFGSLRGHVNRANTVWKTLSQTNNCIVVFQGPETYITPSWYPSKHEHGKAVPTWNYIVVHAYGTPTVVEDKDWLLKHLNTLTDENESNQTMPWKVSDAPDDFTQRMLKAIVGIEIPISKLVGQWKTSQNKQSSDKLGVIAGLHARNDSRSLGMAQYINQHVPTMK